MITYDFVAAALRSLDDLQAELLVLPFFSDERPLRGPAGLIDWRLCGSLSRKLLAGYLDGHFGEKGMVAAPAKLKVDGVLLVGLGPSSSFDLSIAARSCSLIANALRQSKVSTAALALPGRSLGRITALQAMQHWLEANPEEDTLQELSIIERAEDHRALERLFDGIRRHAESPLD